MRAVADKQIAVNLYAGCAKRVYFLQEGEGIEHDPIPDDAATAFTQHAARDELKDELLAVDGHRVSGIVAAGIARHYFEALGENINDFAFAFVAPLGADNHCCLASSQLRTPLAGAPRAQRPRRFAHNSPLICKTESKFGEIRETNRVP